MAVGAADFDARVAQVGEDLGLAAAVLDQPTTTLSGGQAARLALAAILLTRVDVLLLDEPTNDLDFDGLRRLEAFVEGFPGVVVVVSHDRAFLERTVTHVLELDEHSRTGATFGGGWQAYLDERARARRHAEEAYGRYREEVAGPHRAGPAHPAVGGRGRLQGGEEPAGQRQEHQGPQHRHEREAGRQGGPARQGDRADGRRREAVGGVGAAARPRHLGAQRRRGGPARPCRGGAEATSGSDRSTSRCAGPSGSRSSVRTGRARPRSSTRCSGRLPLRVGRPLDGAGRGGGRARPGPAPVRRRRDRADRAHGRRPVRSCPRPGRCWPSSGSAPATWPGRPASCRRGSAPGPRSRC